MILTEVPLAPFSAQHPVPIYLLSTNCSCIDPRALPANIAHSVRCPVNRRAGQRVNRAT